MIKILTRGVVCVAAAAFLSANFAASALAADAFWHGVRSGVWNDGSAGGVSNWYSEAPAAGDPRAVPDGIAKFAPNALRTQVSFNAATTIEQMLFLANVEDYTFTISKQIVALTGAGIVNQASSTPTFKLTNTSVMVFRGNATTAAQGAGDSAIIEVMDRGQLSFEGQSKGGTALVTNEGQGSVSFSGQASADSMSITNQSDNSTGGQARFVNNNVAQLDFSETDGPAGDDNVTAGDITNSGRLLIGPRILTVQQNLTLRQSSRVRINVDVTRAGMIVVNGNAQLNGTLDIVSNGKTKEKRLVLISATGSRLGKFKTVNLPAALLARKAQIKYFGNDVVLTMEKK